MLKALVTGSLFAAAGVVASTAAYELICLLRL